MIRLAELLPGHHDDEISCRLIHVALEDNPQYEAVSYYWGDPTIRSTIRCDDDTLQVTTNLYAALRQLRSPFRPRKLWADTICINQQDIDERSQQERLIKDIFEKAERVLIWLGEEGDDSQHAISVAGELAQAYRDVELRGNGAPKAFGRFDMLSEQPRIRALGQLVTRQWFRRVWVIQELAVSRDALVLCGTESISWDDLLRALSVQDSLNLYLADHEVNACVFNLQNTRQMYRAGVREDLLTILNRHRAFISTDPRDKIFGIRALAKGGTSMSLVNHRLGTAALYTSIAVETIQTSSNLDILSVPPRFEGGNPHELPSWVPDWTWARLCPPLGRSNDQTVADIKFAAGGSNSPDIQFRSGNTELGVQGFCIDRIEAVGKVLMVDRLHKIFPRDIRIPAACYVLDNWFTVAAVNRRGHFPTGELMLDAFIQTLLAESCNNNIRSLREHYQVLAKHTVLVRWDGYLEPYMPRWLLDWVLWALHSFLFLIGLKRLSLGFRIGMSTLGDRRMIRTEKGYIGLASGLAEPGDSVALIRGGRVPLVLRPQGKQWELHGDCYIRGVMHGEQFHEEAYERLWLV
jgi:hypothetical protein